MTNKLKMHTPNLADENFKKLAALFPNAVTETINEDGEVVRAIDADVLRQEISATVVEGAQERYQFTWPDKKKSVVLSNQPIAKTLRLVREKSVGRDGTLGSIDTENIYIEGDNLDALKLLQETYLGKIKMIYIDPPYNTGNDFIYEDDFSQDADEYMGNSGQYDEEGNRLVQNTESNGRFHTDWLNMLYPRLRIAKDFLSEEGLICISIDSNEIGNLRKICSEIFGASNYITEISVLNNPRGRQSDNFVATVHEYLLCFAKDVTKCVVYGMPLTDAQKAEYNYSDSKGAYRLLGLRQRGVASLREDRPDMFFPIYVNPISLEVSLEEHIGWEMVIPKKSDGRDGRWMWGKQKCVIDSERLVARMIERRNEYDIFVKDYLERGENETRTRKYRTIWDDKTINNQVGTQEVKKLLGGEYMSFPKSAAYLQMITRMGSGKDCIVMDFFSGSATTAHAIMQLNAEDGGHRKFILVQLPEVTDEKSEARKAGFKTVCDIGEERIRRAGKKILEERSVGVTPPPQHLHQDGQRSLDLPNMTHETSTLDIGFRVFRVDSSNMKDVYYRPNDFKQGQMEMFADNIKEDRTSEDLLFQVMLDLGVLLSSKIEETTIDGKKVFSVADDYLIACFDKDVTDETVEAIAQKKPFYAVFRDAGIASDSVMTNFEQIFETYSPKTQRKVL